MDEYNKIYHGDCLEIMDELIEQGVKVDCIITDLPYGTTNRNKWDIIIPFKDMWERIEKIIKDNAAILLFADEPFTSQLICSNLKQFKQRITWDKDRGSGFLNAKKMRLKQTEDICLFYKKPCTYNPQMKEAPQDRIRPINTGSSGTYNYGEVKETKSADDYNPNKRYPTNLIKYSAWAKECNPLNRLHPTQKPIEMILNELVLTYTNENDLVLDFTCGVGSTLCACIESNRRYIGIEKDLNYWQIAINRINGYIHIN